MAASASLALCYAKSEKPKRNMTVRRREMPKKAAGTKMTSHKRPLQKLDVFETAENEDRGYTAASGGNAFSIGAAAVEAAVLRKAQFGPVLRLDGTLFAEPEGLDDAVIEAAVAAGDLREARLSALVKQALAP